MWAAAAALSLPQVWKIYSEGQLETDKALGTSSEQYIRLVPCKMTIIHFDLQTSLFKTCVHTLHITFTNRTNRPLPEKSNPFVWRLIKWRTAFHCDFAAERSQSPSQIPEGPPHKFTSQNISYIFRGKKKKKCLTCIYNAVCILWGAWISSIPLEWLRVLKSCLFKTEPSN